MRVARPEESVTIGAALIRWVANRVMAAFQMGLTVTPIEGGAHLTVTLEHELSRRRLPRLLGRALAAPGGSWRLRRVRRNAQAALEDSGQGFDLARVTRCGGLLAMALLTGACARPTVVTAAGPGVPAISALGVTPAHIESGCPLRFRIQFDDAGRDVVRAVARWRAKTGYQRFHEGTDVLPFAPEQLQGKSNGQVEVVVIPPHAGSYVYRVQLEDAQGQSSNVAEARVHVEIRPFWRRPACETPAEDTERVRRPNVQAPIVAGRS